MLFPPKQPDSFLRRKHPFLVKPIALSSLVFFLTIILSIIAWFNTEQRIEKDARSYFEGEANDAKVEVQTRLQHYVDTLYGVQGLFDAYGDIDQEKWQSYIDALMVQQRFPGVADIYFVRYLSKEKKAEFEKKIRKQFHDPSLSIYPSGERERYFPVEFTVPLREDLIKKTGFDFGSDPVRLESMERAVRTGKAAASGKLTLVIDNQPGFSIRIPVFRHGMPLDTLEQRWKALTGFVSLSISIEGLMGSVFDKNVPRDFDFELFDNGLSGQPGKLKISPAEPLRSFYRDHDLRFQNSAENPRFKLTATLNVIGEEWLFYFSTRPDFHFGAESQFPLFVLISGVVISFLLSGITWSLSTARSRAVRLAGEMTLDLRESEEKFRILTKTATDGIITVNRNGEIIYVNEGAHHLSGYVSKELIGKPYSLLIPERFREPHGGDFLKFLHGRSNSRGGKSIELTGLRKDQSEIPVELSMTRWKSNKGLFFTAIIRDISDRKKTEANLNQKNAFVQLLYVVTVAANESSTLEEALQTCLNEICGHMGWQVGHVYFKSAEREKSLYSSMIWYFDQPSLYIPFKIETEKTCFGPGEGLPGMVLERGEPISLQLTSGMPNFSRRKVVEQTGIRFGFAIPLLVKDDVVAVLEFFSKEIMEPDASTLEVMAHIGTQLGRVIERKRAQEELDFLATHDPLSHLPNRALFSDRLQQAIANAGRNNCLAAVLFVDLDQFKRINDTLGHTIGDLALQEVSKRLQACVRAGDTVARWGGDEFTLLFENLVNVRNLNGICHKVLHAVSRPFYVEGKEFHISTSIGVTIAPLDGDNVELLLKNADIAMYRAKEKGRNNFQFYSQEMSVDSSEKLELENSLRHAIENQELLLYYQPFVDLKSEKIVGAEALIRWNHPVLGVISPSKFIPLAEETGLIGPIGEWVLKTACAQNKAWQRMGLPPIRVAVNLSASQFQRAGMVEKVKKTLQETALSPKYLELELTESILMQKTDEMVSTLGKFHEMGIHISIDDFGTGYSSLSYIKKFPIDTLKIDQSFVRDIPANLDDAALSTAIIAMAHSLNLKVIAEAVETAVQMEFFKSRGCNEIQGYYISPPLPPEAFKKFLNQRSCFPKAVEGAPS